MRFAIALVAALLFDNAAIACSCLPSHQSGFVHAKLTHLPANARGVLFLPPPLALEYLGHDDDGILYSGEVSPISPSAFSITSDTQPDSLPVAFSWPDFEQREEPGMNGRRSYRFAHTADEQQYRRAKKRPSVSTLMHQGKLVDITKLRHEARRLMRVAPVDGFKPGRQYKISYNKKSSGWAYAKEVQVTIDNAVLTEADLNFQLQLTGQPRQQMLPLMTGQGSCGRPQPAIVQEFSFTLPDTLQTYSDGVTYFSESRRVPDGKYTEVRYEPSICDERDFGATASGNGKDLIYTDCDITDGPRTLRGWAGFLEVEDKLRLAGTEEINLASASGNVCAGFNMLTKALFQRDKQKIRDIACAMPLRYDGEYFSPLGGAPHSIDPADLPALKDLFQFSEEGDAEDRRCVRRVLWRLIIEAPTAAQTGADKLGELLASLPPDELEHKILNIHELLGELDTLTDRKDAEQRLSALVRPLLPALRETAKFKTPAAKAARAILNRSNTHAKF